MNAPGTAAIGAEIVRLEEVDSTNSLALERPAYLERHGLVLLARHQTGGRGRMGRHWASLPGKQLQFTVVLHPTFAAEHFPLVGLAAALAVAEAVGETPGVRAQLKWPNDVLVGGRKVCGILVEGRVAGGQPRLVLGIGINCNGSAADFPPELRERLTTLAEAAGAPVDPEAVLQAVLARLNAAYDRLVAGEQAALLEAWRAYGLLGGGQRVRVRTAAGEREGVPEDLTAEGYLLVRLPDGSHQVQVSGELDWLE